MQGPDPGAWKRVEPTEVQKVGYRTIVEKMFVQPNGKRHPYTTIGGEGSRAAGCVAITTDGRVIVAKQFRPGPEKMMYEIPGGGVEPGEDPQAAAVRELLEETGYVPGAVTSLGTCSRDAYINGTWYYYLAVDCVLSGDGPSPDDTEHVEVHLLSIDELLHNARNDLMTDPLAAYYAHDELVKLKEIA